MSSDSNLVPRGRDPFAQRQGSLTSGRIRKKKTPLIGRKKSCLSHANFFANQKTVGTLIRFVYTQVLYDLKPLRKTFSSI